MHLNRRIFIEEDIFGSLRRKTVICLRCGYCCTHLDVMIVNPESILQDGTVDPRHSEPLISKPQGTKCPHLEFVGEMATCRIHSFSCYSGTPCDLFEQFGRSDDVCVLGSYYRASSSEGHLKQ